MATRAIDLLIAYRVVKMLVTPFNKQPAFKLGIIDEKGKVLKKFLSLKTTKEKKGGIVSKENFIHLSNLAIFDTKNKSEAKK